MTCQDLSVQLPAKTVRVMTYYAHVTALQDLPGEVPAEMCQGPYLQRSF
jgi:hypothetical protein